MQQNIFKVAVVIVLVILHFKCSKGHAECNQFFNGDPWPKLKRSVRSGVVELCQTQLPNHKYSYLTGKAVFATLYSTRDKIPLYTANVVNINGAKGSNRSHNNLWKRVATSLCSNSISRTQPINSKIDWVCKFKLRGCEAYQAIDCDYKTGASLKLHRGHLSPSCINLQDKEKEMGTFTLTNAAPQFGSFNGGRWRVVESSVKRMIERLVPNQNVYIITGTLGAAIDSNGHAILMNNRVTVPGSFWKAVCYPGNSTHAPWGYAIIGRNTPASGTARVINGYDQYMTLRTFSSIYFRDKPFNSTCLGANMGRFSDFFNTKSFRYVDHTSFPQ